MSNAATKPKMKPAAKFLIIIAVLVSIFIVGTIAFSWWASQNPMKMLQVAFTPTHAFDAGSSATPDYSADENWAALPSNPGETASKPEGVVDVAMVPEADIFYVHPTTLLDKTKWNDFTLTDENAKSRVDNRVMKMQASVYNAAGRVFAPRYRQATFGSFFDTEGNGLKAIGLAFTDVLAAFDNFIAERSDGRPFILAGHSQGSLHLLHLLKERISGTDLQNRMIAAYIVGWPVSMEADLGAMPDIKACERKHETGCVISYQTFGLGGDPSGILAYMDISNGLGGAPRKGTQMLCTNPQDWMIGSNETRSAHLGAVLRSDEDDRPIGKPIKHFTGTQCGTDGILYVTDLPGEAWQDLKMHGENYHVYDYHMFYMNLRENAVLRAQRWFADKQREASGR